MHSIIITCKYRYETKYIHVLSLSTYYARTRVHLIASQHLLSVEYYQWPPENSTRPSHVQVLNQLKSVLHDVCNSLWTFPLAARRRCIIWEIWEKKPLFADAPCHARAPFETSTFLLSINYWFAQSLSPPSVACKKKKKKKKKCPNDLRVPFVNYTRVL